MEEAVQRECLEETGYTVVPEAFAALYEEICTSESIREAFPDYAHKIFHIFRCRLADDPQSTPSEPDLSQVGCRWVDIREIPSIRLRPALVKEHLQDLLCAGSPMYLGSHRIDIK
jgi:8-oxo-dGTP pyrophosphatase MutT (NUDIX family)